MNPLRLFKGVGSLVVGALSLVLAAESASAVLLQVTYTGVTDGGATLNSNSIPAGTPFEVHALFDSSLPFDGGTGYNWFLSQVSAVVNSTTYQDPDVFGLMIADAANPYFPGAYFTNLTDDPAYSYGFVPGFTGTSPTLTAANPGPTVFTGYAGSLLTTLPINTLSDTLVLSYDAVAGVTVSITEVPEPATLGLLALGAVMVLRRRA